MPEPRTLGMFLSLLPRGAAWSRNLSSSQVKVARALSLELDNADNAIDALIAELDPRRAEALLPEWERMAGLVDAFAPYPTALDDRRKVLHARLISRGGHEGSAGLGYTEPLPLWHRIASILGYVLTITENRIGDMSIIQAGQPFDAQLAPGDIGVGAHDVSVATAALSPEMDAALEFLLRESLLEHVSLTMEFT